MKRLAAGVAMAIALSGCSRARPTVQFVGRSEEPLVDAPSVAESETLPRNAKRLGRLLARCTAVDSDEPFETRPLSDVDCSEGRLRLWLRQSAAERGGDVLAELRCRVGSTSDCSAILGRTDRTRAPRVRLTGKERLDVSGGLGAEIWVSYVPSRPGFDRPLRAAESVGELPSLPLSHFIVGSLESECEVCDERALRQALRVTAGRLGASDLISVRCLAGTETERCVGGAAAPEQVEP